MIFGDPTRFALEAELVPPPTHFRNGYLWIWAGGQRLGDGQLYSLLIPASALVWCLGSAGQRHDDPLAGQDKEAALRCLRAVRDGSSGDNQPRSQVALDRFHYFKFIVCDSYYPPFDDLFAGIIGHPAGERFIWQVRDNPTVCEVLLEAGEFDAAVRSFLSWLESETGFRAEQQDWWELSEAEREEIRQAVLRRKPSLARADRRSDLEQWAIAELLRRRADASQQAQV